MPKKNLPTKKGPKGKKARKLAKLDRQWGEQANEDAIKNARIRKGKRRLIGEHSESRVKSKQPRHNNSVSTGTEKDEVQKSWNYGGTDSLDHNSDGHESDDSDASSEQSADDGFKGEQYALSSLMKNINNFDKRKATGKKIVQVTGGNVDESSHDEESENDNDDADEYEIEVSDADSDDDDTDYSSLQPIGENPFLYHFNKEPLSESEVELPPDALNMKKVRTEELNDDIVVQLSGKVLKVTIESEKSGDISKTAFSHVRKLLMSNWRKFNRKQVMKNADSDSNSEKSNELFSSFQDSVYGPLSLYSDAIITCSTRENIDAINNVIVLHVVNHVLTSNHEITMNNNRIRDLKSVDGEDMDADEKWRDQGYTRPKVLILLPTRSTAFSFVKDVMKLVGAGVESSVDNLDRFNSEFGNLDESPETDERRRKILEAKGKDWNELFADHVNSDDDFKVGISFSKKKEKKAKSKDDCLAMKIYSDFYHSDIIIASPLGLKMAITTDDEDDDDTDFLSSIEMVVSLRSDVMLMQNWDHVVNIMNAMNQQPKKSNRTDFSRVRNYLLLGQAARWRQFVMVSQFSDPYLLSTFNRHAKSIAGRMKLRRKVPSDEASICNVMAKVRQVFQLVPCDTFATQGDKRLKYFNSVLLPQLLRTKQKHTLFYIPSYFDFVALRNILLKHDIASSHFVSITEYSRNTEVSRGRARFLQGRKRFLLYTGRAHFFMRHHIKGAKHLIMFGLPEHAEFYPELLNMLAWRPETNVDEESQFDISTPASCLNLFTKYEAHNLERIVGTKHSERMVKGEKNTFLFQS